jgi:hypothetical protein
VKNTKKVIMKKKEFVSEHKKLVTLLKNPNKKKLRQEAKKQSKELYNITG